MKETTKNRATGPKNKITILFTVITVVLWVGATVFLLAMLIRPGETAPASKIKTDITADFEYMLATKMRDLVEIDSGETVFASEKRVFTLSDQDIIAPEPNPACYGTADDPKEMEAVLLKAQKLLDVQDTLFTTETEIVPGSQIKYYLDDTIYAVTWKQGVGGSTYTFSEVKIAHASQFRRFLSDGKFASSALYTTQEMARSVNAVTASSGDYYGYRLIGICVDQGTVYRGDARFLDTCFIDENGDLLFSYRGEFKDKQAVQQYVEDNNIRFSLSFGPALVENGQRVVPPYYEAGEINERSARTAICQMGPLHYVMVVSNFESPYNFVHTMHQFAKNLQELGIPKAYALDGGQTATLVMDDQVINQVSYGAQRPLSDIIYFATALPEDEWE